MDQGRLRIFAFKIHEMIIDPAIVLVAKRGTGKSFVTRDILYNLRKIPCGIVISPTDRLNSFYKAFFPDIYIHYDIRDTVLRNLLYRQVMMLERYREARQSKHYIDPRAILVMDDCLAQGRTWIKNECIKEILMNGRHYKLTYILTMQSALGIPPDLRGQFDYLFLLKEDYATQKKKLHDHYAGIFPTLRDFEKVFAICTEKYRCMVIDNRKPGTSISEKVFWFLAKERKFSFGSKTFKELHRRYYDKNFMITKNPYLRHASAGMGSKKRAEPEFKVELRD